MGLKESLWRYAPGDGQTLWVIFSARGIPPGKFSMSGLMRELPGCKLFINCEKNSWYLDVEDEIRAKISEYPHPNRLFIGSSMGGAGALMFGQDATRILAFAPNPIIGARFTHSALYVKEKGRDVTAGIDPSVTTIVFGIYDPADAMSFASLRRRDLGFNLLPMKTNHDAAGTLAHKGHILPMLKTFYEGKRRVVIPDEFRPSREDVLTALSANRVLTAIDKDPSPRNFEALDALPPRYRWPVWQKLVEHSPPDLAYDYAEEAVRRYPGAGWAINALIRSAYQLKDPGRHTALQYLPAYLELNKSERAQVVAKAIRAFATASG